MHVADCRGGVAPQDYTVRLAARQSQHHMGGCSGHRYHTVQPCVHCGVLSNRPAAAGTCDRGFLCANLSYGSLITGSSRRIWGPLQVCMWL